MSAKPDEALRPWATLYISSLPNRARSEPGASSRAFIGLVGPRIFRQSATAFTLRSAYAYTGPAVKLWRGRV
jgi:hypothetical protein